MPLVVNQSQAVNLEKLEHFAIVIVKYFNESEIEIFHVKVLDEGRKETWGEIPSLGQ